MVNSDNAPSGDSENLCSEDLKTSEELKTPAAPTKPDNPFLEIRTRSIIWWIPIGILGLGCLLLLLSIPWAIFVLFGDPDAGAASLAYPDPILFVAVASLWFYGLMAYWCFL
ncbi:MAG: hypothetical protein SVX43_18500 [Cyanobacteriota bacterium]|nr:hypothetical protein [Cyanobacteriota bacterium]